MKQRLVGAVVLVALAVIFLPMLLDGSGPSGPRDVAIDIPDQPQPPPNQLEQPTDTQTDDTGASTSGATDSPSGAEPQSSTMREQPVPSGPAGERTTASDQPSTGDGPAAPSTDSSAAAADESTTDDTASSPSEPPSGPEPPPEADDPAADDSATAQASDTAVDDADSAAWVVQVGSFGRETNALVLRDRLRELGFDTFVERADTDQGTVWRVRVGPVASEAEAERLSERVTEERGGPALVMTQP